MATYKRYMVCYAAGGFSNNTGNEDVYVAGLGIVAAKSVPTTWNYIVDAANADEARSIAWPMFMQDVFGNADDEAIKHCPIPEGTMGFECVSAKPLAKASSGSLGKDESGNSRNAKATADGKAHAAKVTGAKARADRRKAAKRMAKKAKKAAARAAAESASTEN